MVIVGNKLMRKGNEIELLVEGIEIGSLLRIMTLLVKLNIFRQKVFEVE